MQNDPTGLDDLFITITPTRFAEKLFISDGTVKAHLKNIYQKLNVGKRREAIEKAKNLGLL